MDYDGFVRVVLTLNPPGYREHALLMQPSRYCEEAPVGGKCWGGDPAPSGTVSTAPGAEADYARWGVRLADLDTLGADAAVTIRVLPPVVEAAYPEVGLEAVVRFAPLDDFRVDLNEVLFARIWRKPGEQDKLSLVDHTLVGNGGS